ncbi:MAG: thiol:disulfide interchange protein [Gallionellales bacterium RIFCSPLOWO2_12_FULL_59_22]|nr:MAG: thiol:disulfide interchange protein [Gallionellales bacterium RIFCSPLOWO2_02_FULL_59_110]OGT02685.1 MAG: thiol:disulfide interchange protein [Gallionellales bacterium RIFCSPLOWO2_02_58_13]OGT11092.1 MAG: thiol:disulfide interchange protein [Gallionellales bacterium RIFCSPLOWO2_12_FULL_59_22]
MTKWFALFLLVCLPSAQAGENEIRQSLQSKFPEIGKLEHVVKTPYAGLYEIVVNGQLLYTDAQGQYLFDGSVIEVKNRRDMTEERRRVLFAVEFDKLPLDLALKRVKGNGKRKLAYFSDPNCGYCKRLENELSKVDNVTLYIFMYPLFKGSDETVRNVSCANDPVKAWDDLMLKGIAPASASCEVQTEKVLALGKKLRVSGTPNLIFGDGTQVPGYLPAEELEKRFDAAPGKK